MRNPPDFTAMLAAASVVGMAAILAVTLLPSPAPVRAVPGVTASFSLSVSDHQLSSSELLDPDRKWRELQNDTQIEESQFAYVTVALSNGGIEDRSLVIQNATRNFYTVFLEKSGHELRTKYRQGDPVPARESPLRHTRAAFPVMLRSGAAATYVLEYVNERDVVIDPEVLDSADWAYRAGRERDIGNLIASAVMCLALLNLIAGITLYRGELVRLSFLAFSILFFFLRQTRLLLLILNSVAYAEWLYPLSIGLELVSAHLFFGFLMGKNFSPWQHASYRVLAALSAVLVGVSFFFQPYTMADILNVLALVTLIIVLVGVYHAARNRDRAVLRTMLAFAPWLAMMAVEIVIIYVHPRAVFLAEYRQAFGMLLTVLLVTVTGMYRRDCLDGKERETLIEERDEAARKAERCLKEANGAERRVRSRIAADCALPLDEIVATALALGREHPDPGVASASRLIASEASNVKSLIARPDGGEGGQA